MLKTEKAYLAAGCFWGVEEAFRTFPGVMETRVGYAGGNFTNPTYEKVCEGNTGHTETVEIEFDPSQTSFEKIIKKFWTIHDPTTFNRQGHDVGSQYRSVIFYLNENQKKIAEESKQREEESGDFNSPIITEITPLKKNEFYLAEDYHQKYILKTGRSVC